MIKLLKILREVIEDEQSSVKIDEILNRFKILKAVLEDLLTAGGSDEHYRDEDLNQLISNIEIIVFKPTTFRIVFKNGASMNLKYDPSPMELDPLKKVKFKPKDYFECQISGKRYSLQMRSDYLSALDAISKALSQKPIGAGNNQASKEQEPEPTEEPAEEPEEKGSEESIKEQRGDKPDPYGEQDSGPERMLSSLKTPNSAVWSFKIENAGDIFREFSKYTGGFVDKGYVFEKLNYIRDFLPKWKNQLHDDDSYETFSKLKRDELNKIRDAYKKLPTYSVAQKLAIKLVLALIDGNYEETKKYEGIIRNQYETLKKDNTKQAKNYWNVEK